ncbi:MAG: translation elongation factor Ts [bacterium]|nr:elongation factor Ts [Gammaproteobacteria bacterium]HIL98548.1 elongation factor Ts [Pseudomonadales bacterium]
MAAISASMVKELRERTGLGMMDCKKALVEAKGDAELAIENLRKSSGMKAAKKAGRTAAEGTIGSRSEDGNAIMVEVNCETDFAARDENFVRFVETVTNAVFEARESDVEKLLADGLEKVREELVQKIGENISIRRAAVVEGNATSYIHTTGKIGVLVSLDGGSEDLGRDIAMHIAAVNPQYLQADDVPEDVIAKEKDIYVAQANESGKPPEIVEKMVQGRIRKFLAEISLVDQPFVKDADIKIGALLKKEGATITQFTRFEVGEGIEIAEVDFATEVASQLKEA